MKANQIFLGYPWRNYRAHWELLVSELHKKHPLHFVAIGRQEGQPAAQLLVKILKAIETSSLAFYDASGGNANVSLEYGYARSCLGEDKVYLFLDEDAPNQSGPGSPIISDLAGSVANRYKMSDTRLKTTLAAIVERHPYVKRFNKFCRNKGYRGGTRKFLIRIIRQLDDKESILRRELIDDVCHDAKKDAAYVERYLKLLHDGGLITVGRGNEYSSRVSISG